MKTRMCRLEFGVNCLADIRFLYYAWDRLWTLEGGVPPHSIWCTSPLKTGCQGIKCV